MAISNSTVWEVRATNGSDTNGGGFVAGASGTDYSQQNAKNTVGSNISTTDVAATGVATVISATAAFTSAIVGNILYFAGGTGSLAAGWYQVVTFTNSTTIILDRAIATGTGITMNIGGALQSVIQCCINMLRSNKAFVKAEGIYVQTASAVASATSSVSPTIPRTSIYGYTTTRGDNGKATIQLSTNTGIFGFSVTASNWDISNFIIDCNSLGTTSGISHTGGANLQVYNCLIENSGGSGLISTVAGDFIEGCEITNAQGGAALSATVGPISIVGNYIHDNSVAGISITGNSLTLIRNIIANNTGASSDGLILTVGIQADTIIYNTFHANGRHGINYSGATANPRAIQNNIFSNNGGYGMVGGNAAGNRAYPQYDGNAYYLNTSGARLFCDDTTVNKQNGVAPYTNVNDVSPTSSPYVAAASFNWNLNQNGTGGGIVRGAGVPKTWPAFSGTNSPIANSFTDMGAVEHQDPGSAG